MKEEYQIKCEIKEELKQTELQPGMQEKLEKVEESFDEVLVLMSAKQAELENILNHFQLVAELNEQVLWCQDSVEKAGP